MEALELLQRLISNPKEQDEYKRGPKEYLSKYGVVGEAQKEIIAVLRLGCQDQVATVFKFRASANPDHSSGPLSCAELQDPQIICLETKWVNFISGENFLIEKDIQPFAVFLQHSYAHIDTGAQKFSFYLEYIAPDDPGARRQVLKIATDEIPEPDPKYDCNGMRVAITTPYNKFVLLRANISFRTQLRDGSHYNPVTRTLYLNFNQHGPLKP